MPYREEVSEAIVLEEGPLLLKKDTLDRDHAAVPWIFAALAVCLGVALGWSASFILALRLILLLAVGAYTAGVALAKLLHAQRHAGGRGRATTMRVVGDTLILESHSGTQTAPRSVARLTNYLRQAQGAQAEETGVALTMGPLGTAVCTQGYELARKSQVFATNANFYLDAVHFAQLATVLAPEGNPEDAPPEAARVPYAMPDERVRLEPLAQRAQADPIVESASDVGVALDDASQDEQPARASKQGS